MSLEAIEAISAIETGGRERKAAAEQTAKELTSAAEREGLALLRAVRQRSDEEGKALLAAAESRAQSRAEAILSQARQSGETLRASAQQRLARAADEIVGRVVK